MPCSAFIAIGSVPIYLVFFFYISLEHLYYYFFAVFDFRRVSVISPSGKKGNTILTISSISTIYNIFGVNLPTVCLGVA